MAGARRAALHDTTYLLALLSILKPPPPPRNSALPRNPAYGLSRSFRYATPVRLLLFTDTLADVNGVSRFIRNSAAQALSTHRGLHVFTSTNFDCPQAPNLHNFKPLAAIKMPGYPNLELTAPPLLKMLREARRLKPDVIHISTPGPVGCVGRLAARALRIPTLGVYHTDFPAYIDRLFDNDLFTALARTAMRRFYRRFATIFTRSQDYAESVARLGIPRERIVPLRPGIMTDQFHPRARDTSIWPHYGCDANAVRFLYVGRVSIEKNLPLLTRVWKAADAALRARNTPAELIIIGDGPYRPEMEEALAGANARFLGFRYNEELSRLYASADAFLFPSTTDTLGQVVMEAQAAGLPVLVTDQGGPKEVVEHAKTGFILPATNPAAWTDLIIQLATNPTLRATLSAAAHTHIQPFSMAASFDHFWSVHEQAVSMTAPRQTLIVRASVPAPLQSASTVEP
jgi:glycosyltransferase involved in cell wall biosynthesis